MPAMSVTLEEKSRYTIVVEAEDREAAVEAATEMFCQSEKPFSDFEGERDELRAFDVVDARPWEVLTETRLEREAAAEAAKAAKSESPEAQAIGDHAALLSSALDYLERYADLNDEPAGGDCRRLIASIAKVVGSAPSSLTPAEDDKKSLAEATARAYGWEHGGDGDGIWWDTNEADNWKGAVSWGTTFASAAEVCEAHALDLRAGQMFHNEERCRRLTDVDGKAIAALSEREMEAVSELSPMIFDAGADPRYAFVAAMASRSVTQHGILIAVELRLALTDNDVATLSGLRESWEPQGAEIWLTAGPHALSPLEMWAFLPDVMAHSGFVSMMTDQLFEVADANALDQAGEPAPAPAM
ncbi:hypothetical protein [Xanthobacter aminoxidans]|uniref:Uncharacterized protein n=1 Tax=Xanthobacter aminoxidans TaxID=186280 RepID=A0ABW6ZRJ1_9HYPH